MPTLEELSIVINANTNALFKATTSIDKFEKSTVKSTDKINKAFKDNTKVLGNVVKDIKKKVSVERVAKKSTTDVERAQVRQSKALVGAREKYLNLSSAIKRSGMEQEKMDSLLQKTKSTIGAFTKSMGAGSATTQKFTEAQNKFTRRMGESKRELTEFNSELRKSNMKKAAKETKELQRRMEELTKSVQIALGPLSGVASRITAFTALMKSGAAPVAIFAGTIIGFSFALIKSASAAAIFQMEVLRMDAILKATGRTAQITVEELAVVADRLGEATLTTESAARRAISVLLSFPTLPAKNMKEILGLAQDLSSVMKLDLSSAAAQLGRALEDPVGGMSALRRAGVIFSEQEKELIKDLVELNMAAEAQEIILNNLAGTLGGAAKREAEGLAGAWDTLKERMTDFLNIAGAVVAEPLTDWLKDINERMKSLANETDIAKRVGILFAETILLLRGAFDLLKITLDGLNIVSYVTGFTNLLNVLGAITEEVVPTLKSEKKLRDQIAVISAKEGTVRQLILGIVFRTNKLWKQQADLIAKGSRTTFREKARLRGIFNALNRVHQSKVSHERELFSLIRRRAKFEAQLAKRKEFTRPLKEAAASITAALKRAIAEKTPEEIRAEKAKKAHKDRDLAATAASVRLIKNTQSLNKFMATLGASSAKLDEELAEIHQENTIKKIKNNADFQKSIAKTEERARAEFKKTQEESKRFLDRMKKDRSDTAAFLMNLAIRGQKLIQKATKKDLDDQQKSLVGRAQAREDDLAASVRVEEERRKIVEDSHKFMNKLDKEDEGRERKVTRELMKIWREHWKQIEKDRGEARAIRLEGDKLVLESRIAMAAKERALVEQIADIQREANKTQKMFVDSFVSGVSSGFADMIVNGERAKDVIGNLIKSMAHLIVRVQIYNALVSAFGLGGAGGGTTGTGTYQPPNFANPGSGETAGLAHGGPLSKNQPAIVGELGPELFVPKSSGKIIPNNKLGGENKVNVNIYNQNNSDVTIRETPSGNGGVDIEVMISNIVASNIRNNGIIAQGINESFGSRPRTTQR